MHKTGATGNSNNLWVEMFFFTFANLHVHVPLCDAGLDAFFVWAEMCGQVCSFIWNSLKTAATQKLMVTHTHTLALSISNSFDCVHEDEC